MQVDFSPQFIKLLDTLDTQSQDMIADFVGYVEQHGLRGLEGRNKPSIPRHIHTKKGQAQYAYAQKHCLWHYHIGIPHYVGEWGDKTSEYVLHYQRFDDRIVLVGISAHPPFVLPII